MSNFEIAVHEWLRQNDIDCDISFAEDFGYDVANNTLQIGTIAHEQIATWFEQFLYEYGMEYYGILHPVLSCIHEIGHYFTIKYFSLEEQLMLELAKMFIDADSECEFMNKYWEIPDEFAANIWAVNFINSHIEAVEGLCYIYIDFWNDFLKERKVAA